MINMIRSSIGNIMAWNSLHKQIDIPSSVDKLNSMSEKDLITLGNEIVANKEEFIRKSRRNTFLMTDLESLEHLLIIEKKMIRSMRKNNTDDDIITVDSILTAH